MKKEEQFALKLEEVISIFRLDQSNENLTNLLNVLLQSRLVVPCQMRVEPGYEDVINHLSEGDSIEGLEGVCFVAEILKANNGTRWIPYFTTGNQMPKNYLSTYSKMDYKFEDICTKDLLNNKEVNGIVINPFSESFYMDKKLLEFLYNTIQDDIIDTEEIS